MLTRLLPADHRSTPGYARSFARWAVAGLLLRLAIMPFTWSDDAAKIQAFASLLPEQGVLFIHTYMREHYASMLDAEGWSYYPLPAYLTFGFWQVITGALVPGLIPWLAGVRELYAHEAVRLPQAIWVAGELPLFRALLLLKVPLLVADIGIALLLPRLIADPKGALFAHRLWVLNPVTLYATYAYAQFEIIEALFMVAALLVARHGHPRWAIALLGFAATYKHIPLLLIPPAALILGQTWRQRFVFGALGATPYLAVRLLAALSAPGAEGIIGWSRLNAQWLAPPSRLALVLALAMPVAYAALLLGLHVRRSRLPPAPTALARSWLLVLLLLLSGLPYIGAYWYVLITPLLVLECARTRGLWRPVAAHAAALVPWAFSPGFHWGVLLAPLHPLFFPALPTPASLVSLAVPWGYVARASWYLFLALTGYLAIRLLWGLLSRQGEVALPRVPIATLLVAAGGSAALLTFLWSALGSVAPPPPALDSSVRSMWQATQPDEYAPLAWDRPVGQTFVSSFPNLSAIELYVRPAAEEGADLSLQLRRDGPAGAVVAESQTRAGPGATRVRFDLPVQSDSAGTRYYFIIRPPSPAAHSPLEAGWTANPFAHPFTGGRRFAGAEPAEGDVAFEAFHDPPSARIALGNAATSLWSDRWLAGGYVLLGIALVAALVASRRAPAR